MKLRYGVSWLDCYREFDDEAQMDEFVTGLEKAGVDVRVNILSSGPRP